MAMRKSLLSICLMAMCAWMLPARLHAQPAGEIRAEPNPCRIEGGRHDCAVSLMWHTRGVERAKVFVVAEGKHPGAEREFSGATSCEIGTCTAPWIEDGTRYIFQLVDFTHGDRGNVLGSVVVTAGGPTGEIMAEPNPCRLEPGKNECTTHIAWRTQGVEHAKVFVVAEGRHPGSEREFGNTVSCEPHTCRAPWIEPETRYIFQLVDFSHGDRGRVLASVVVSGAR
jgi:hypothetical protein